MEQGRITNPMGYDSATDHYVPITWPGAFALIGKELRGLSHPNQAGFYTSGRPSNAILSSTALIVLVMVCRARSEADAARRLRPPSPTARESSLVSASSSS